MDRTADVRCAADGDGDVRVSDKAVVRLQVGDTFHSLSGALEFASLQAKRLEPSGMSIEVEAEKFCPPRWVPGNPLGVRYVVVVAGHLKGDLAVLMSEQGCVFCYDRPEPCADCRAASYEPCGCPVGEGHRCRPSWVEGDWP